MENRQSNVCGENTFQDLHQKISKDLYNFLYYKYGAENNPYDVVQEAFLKLWDNCKNVVPEKARSFLFTVANNKVLNDLSRKKTVLNYHKVYNYDDTSNESPEFKYRENEFSDQLQDALQSLTEDQRVTFMLNRIDGMKHKEIAEIMGISKKAVEKRIYTAVKILKDKLEDFK